MKRADLSPPLGHPGGPCYVVKRILENVHDQHLRDQLIKEIEEGDDLSNPQAARIYNLDVERGVGKVKFIVIGPHAAYRMDLRGVNVPVVRAAVQRFLKQANDWKSQQDWHYAHIKQLLDRGQAVDYTDPRTGLTIIFALDREDRFKLVTTYWKGEPDPKPVPAQMCVTAGYRSEDSLPGVKTLVEPPGHDREPDSVLPSPPNTRSKPVFQPHFQTPPSSDEAPGGKNLHEDRARTLGVPGGDEHPWVDNSTGYHQIRPDITASDIEAAMKGPPYPGSHRQRNQLGVARRYYQQRYRRERVKLKMRANKWYRRYRNDGRLKLDKQRRRDQPKLFERKPGGGYHSMKDRSQDYREEQKKTASMIPTPIPFLYRPTDQGGWFLGVDDDTGVLLVDIEGPRQLTLDTFFDDAVFGSEEDIDRLFRYLDSVFEMSVTADMGVEVLRIDDNVTPPDQKFDRATDPQSTWPDKIPAEEFNNIRAPDYGGGSSKVFPFNSDLVNKEAARIADIQNRCDPGLLGKAENVRIRLRRVDPKKLMWLFEVAGSKGGIYKVKVKVVPAGNVRDVNKADVFVSCSCPYWRWQGPEHWAQEDDYLLGKPVGLATRPEHKDPDGTHGACKHVLAVLQRVSTFILPRPTNKTASLHYLAERLAYGLIRTEPESMAERLAARFISRVND